MNRADRRRINRQNAQASTGPVTAPGKQASSQNALKPAKEEATVRSEAVSA